MTRRRSIALAVLGAVVTLSGETQAASNDPTVRFKPGEIDHRLPDAAAAPLSGPGQPIGYLSGKSVFVSAGHGWRYTGGAWDLQRTVTHGVAEDLASAESVNLYLIDYLRNAGAGVYTCRERDLNTNMVIVDDSDAVTTGTWSLDATSGYGGGTLRTTASMTETATATFTPAIPEAGEYQVSIWYSGGPANTVDATVAVDHGGGQTTFVTDLTRDGDTWVYLGRFYCPVGSGGCAVIVSNLAASGVGDVVADAVRFGGGTGTMTPFGEPAASGKPRFEESGLYHANFMGCPEADCGSSSVNAMPRYARWENEPWEDSVYISWHSNAFNGSSRGTSTFVYGNNPPDGSMEFAGVPGSVELAEAIQDEVVNDIRARFDPGWNDRGVFSAYFAELNPAYNDEMPAAWLELAFHDNQTDASHLLDPAFRRVAARAVYQGIVRYFAARDGDPSPDLLPEPPENLSVIAPGDGTAVLSWSTPPHDTEDGLFGDAATGFRVYRSPDGRGFGNPIDVPGAATTQWVDTTLAPGEEAYYRVTATNAGGESFPTEVMGVGLGAGTAEALVVSGFDRLDRFMNVQEFVPEVSAFVSRGDLDRMNDYDYVRVYGKALGSQGVSWDSASNEAIISGQVALSAYRQVIWFTGEESSADRTFDPTEQSLVDAYLTGGGNLFVSGAEIGWDLDQLGNGPTFYQDRLKASLVSDDGDSYSLSPNAGGIFAGNPPFAFDDGSFGEYDANYPDVIAPLGGATACLTYSGGSEGTAAIQYAGDYRLVYFGFPFETITDPVRRAAIMSDVLAFFAPPAPPPPVPDGVIGPALQASVAGSPVSSIELIWDVSLCPATAYHLIHGDLSTVGSLVVTGGACSISTTGTHVWSDVPPQDLWFLLVGDDGDSVEGSWGESSAGTRAPGLASGVCGMSVRDDLGTCP